MIGKKKVVILGGGGHCKVVLDILKDNSDYDIIGLIATNPDEIRVGASVYKVLGDDKILPKIFKDGIDTAFVAIGDNQTRLRLLESLWSIGFNLLNAISPFSYVSDSVQLGKGVAVMPGAVINVDTVIGDGAIVNTGSSVDHDCSVGACVHVAPGTRIAGNVTVGQGTFLGVGTKVIDKMTIGSWSIIGAGSVVIKDIPDRVLCVGVPAIVKKILL